MANRRRGDVEAIFDGETYKLRLTLGALAELEDAFNVTDLVGLAGRFENGRLSARDLLRVLAAGLRGGGANLGDEQVARMACDGGLEGCIEVAAQLLQATFGESGLEGCERNPPAPQDA